MTPTINRLFSIGIVVAFIASGVFFLIGFEKRIVESDTIPSSSFGDPFMDTKKTVLFSPNKRPLRVDGFAENGPTRAGGNAEDVISTITLHVPTTQTIQGVYLSIDSGENKSYPFESVSTGDETSVEITSLLHPISIWLEDGTHHLSWSVTTEDGTWSRVDEVIIDATPPRFTREADGVRITDDHPLAGATLLLLDRTRVEESVEVAFFSGNGKTGLTIPLKNTDNLVMNSRYFRIITASDEWGNLSVFSPDDSRSMDVVLQEYRSHSREEETASYSFSSESVGEIGPVYIFTIDEPGIVFPGDAWGHEVQLGNVNSFLEKGIGIASAAGKKNGYALPLILPPSSPPIFVDPSEFSQWGIQEGLLKVQYDNGAIGDKKVAFLDATNADSVGLFVQKGEEIKAQNMGSIPVFVVDFKKGKLADYDGTVIKGGAYWPSKGFMDIVYFAGLASGNTYDIKKMELIVAHETGHALGLGHASDEKNLMYPLQLDGKSLDAAQSGYVAGHVASNGLLPSFFGLWKKDGMNDQAGEFACQNRLLNRGKPNVNNPAYFEETEDTFAGTFKPTEATTVVLDDWKGNGSVDYFLQDTPTQLNWKACPILRAHQYEPTTGGWIRWNIEKIPVAVPNSISALYEILERFDTMNEVPDLRFTPPVNTNPQLPMCGCYTPCEIACSYSGAINDPLGLGNLCVSYCGGDPHAETTKENLTQFFGTTHGSNSDGESCAANSLTFSQNWQSGEICKDDCAAGIFGQKLYCWTSVDCKCHATPQPTISPPVPIPNGDGGTGHGGGTSTGTNSQNGQTG